jgi:hypothetical protein
MPETTPDVSPADLTAEERALGQQHSPHRWYREDAVARIVAARVAAERAEWDRQATSFDAVDAAHRVWQNAPRDLYGKTLVLRMIQAALAQPAATEPGTAGEQCGWCGHLMISKPPFDCKNPMHAASPSAAAAPDEGERCADCGHVHTPTGCTGSPTASDRWAGVTPAACDCPAPSVPTEDTAAKEGEQ